MGPASLFWGRETGPGGHNRPARISLRCRFWKVVMKAVVSFVVAWAFCGALAAFFSFGPALVRVVAFGPISLAQALA